MSRLGPLLVLAIVVFHQCFGAPSTHAETDANVLPRAVAQNLYLNNPFDSGDWGIIELCADGSFVEAVEIKYLPPGNLDENAINAVKLYCKDITTGLSTGYITSSEGRNGDWWGMFPCTTGLMTGFRANVLPPQGLFGDDVAVENFEMDCGHGMEIVPGLPFPVPMKAPQKSPVEPFGFNAGVWSDFAICRDGLAVCGIQTRVDDGGFASGTVEVADIVLFCCDTAAVLAK